MRLAVVVVLAATLLGTLSWAVYHWLLPASWNQNSAKNIVIVPATIEFSTKHILFASISYAEAKASLNLIPAELPVEVPGGYGQYPLRSVYPLLGLDQQPPSTVVATYSHILGLPIDEVWVVHQPTLLDQATLAAASTDGAVSRQFVAQLATAIRWQQLQTPLRLKERWQLAQFLQDRPLRVVAVTDLAQWQQQQAQRYLGRFKNCRVAIVNAAQVRGLGSRVSAILERTGATVVRLTDAESVVSSQITVLPAQLECQSLIQHLQHLFPQPVPVTTAPDLVTRSRSELEVILGTDLGQFVQPR